MIRQFAGLVVAAGAVLFAGPAPRFNAWKIIGPGEEGGMFLPSISPHDPNVLTPMKVRK
jgi:hypothetical protein